MRFMGIVVIWLVASPAIAMECASATALQAYEDARDRLVHLDEDVARDPEVAALVRHIYGRIRSSVTWFLVKRSGTDKYGANMLMPVLSNSRHILDSGSQDVEARLSGALGIMNNTAWSMIEPAGIDEMTKDALMALEGRAPISLGMLQDRIYRRQLGAGCSGVTEMLPPYEGHIGSLFAYRNVCQELDLSVVKSPFPYSFDFEEEGASGAVCTALGVDENDKAMLQVTIVVYDSIARAQAAFDSGDEVSYLGAEPVRILDDIFFDDAVKWDISDTDQTNWQVAKYRVRNMAVMVDGRAQANYSDVTVRPVPLKSSLAPIAKQAFELMWQTE